MENMRIRLYTSHLSRPILGPMLEHPTYIEVNNDFSENRSVHLGTFKLGERVLKKDKKCDKNQVVVDVSPHSTCYCCP